MVQKNQIQDYSVDLEELRRRAKKMSPNIPRDTTILSQEDIQKLLERMQIYQVELESQNEELSQMHLALNESRNRYYDLFDMAPVGYITLDRDGQILETNLAAAELLGEKRKALQNKSFYLFLSDNEQQEFYDQCRITRKTGRNSFEIPLLRRDGTRMYAHMESRTIPGSSQLKLTISDISALKSLEQEIRRQNDKNSAILEALTDALSVIDRQGMILQINHAFLDVMAYQDYADVLGREVFDFARKSDESMVRELLNKVQRQGSVSAIVLPVVRGDGTEILMEINASLIPGDEDAIVVIGRDITEQQRLHNQLQEAQKMETIARLAGGISHDFNNLLTIIEGYCDLMLGSLKPSDIHHKYVTQIDTAATRAETLTRQLRAFSRTQVRHPLLLDLNRHLSKMEHMLTEMIGENIDLVMELEPRLKPVLIDPNQMEQIVLNLLLNARDSITASGEISIKTELVLTDSDLHHKIPEINEGEYVRFTIGDNGQGLSEEDKMHIFEPFFSNRPFVKGSGLGLASVYGIVKQNDGHIMVDSQPGGGSVFTLLFPAARGKNTIPERSTQAETSLGGNETILMADDEANVRILVTEILQSYGYRVLQATNGVEALSIFSGHPDEVDLVITDMLMPQMGGAELINRLRLIRPDLKVIFISGYVKETPGLAGRLKEPPVFLQKPFSLHTLMLQLRQVLDRE